MDFEYSAKTKQLIGRVQAFMDQHIYPNERRFFEENFNPGSLGLSSTTISPLRHPLSLISVSLHHFLANRCESSESPQNVFTHVHSQNTFSVSVCWRLQLKNLHFDDRISSYRFHGCCV